MTTPLLRPTSPQELPPPRPPSYPHLPKNESTLRQAPTRQRNFVEPFDYLKPCPTEISYEYDSTGTFHWCSARSMDHCLFSRQAMARMVLNGHVVVCLFAEHDSPLIGLRNLIMPLRASNLKYLTIVF